MLAVGTALHAGSIVQGTAPAAGTLDPTFGIGGRVTTDFIGPNEDIAQDVLVQSDGRIVVAGSTRTGEGIYHGDAALIRLNPDGTLDETFGVNGYVAADFDGRVENIYAAALQPDDKIVVAGSSGLRGPSSVRTDFALARFMPDGSLDPSFGANGVVITDFGTTWDQAHAVAIGPDGKIVAAGYGAGKYSLVARYNADGSSDASFGIDGYATSDFGSAWDVVVQPDGAVVVAGAGGGGFALIRFTASGALDPAFGSGGRVSTGFGYSFTAAQTVTLQPDGKIVAAGYAYNTGMAAARYTANGALDSSFSGDGKTVVGDGHAYAYDVAVDPGGKVLLGGVRYGNHQGQFGVARLNPDGTLDPTFNGGFVTAQPGDHSLANGLALQADGNVLLTGSASSYVSGEDFAIVRLNGTGHLDISFHDDGMATHDFIGPNADYAFDVVEQRDGKVVVGGYTFGTRGGFNIALARYNADGTLHPSFGNGGRVQTDLGGYEMSRSIALQPDGKIVAAGATYTGADAYDFAVLRYNADGTLDPSFGNGGVVTTDFGGGVDSYDAATSIAVQPDGKIIVAGGVFQPSGGTGEDFGMARYNSDGTLDSSFGDNGRVITDFPGIGSPEGEEGALGVAIDSRDRIVLAGGSTIFGGSLLKIARYTPDGRLDRAFGSGGFIETTDVAVDWLVGRPIAIAPGDAVVAAGIVQFTTGISGSDVCVLRFTDRGEIDSTFGTGGRVVIDRGSNDRATGIGVQAHGKIVVASEFRVPPTYHDRRAIVRLTRNGALDESFGTAGVVETDTLGYGDGVRSFVFSADGKILAAGSHTVLGTADDFVLERYQGIGGPEDAAAGIIGQLLALKASELLNRGQTNALLQRVESAIAALEEGSNDDARRDLEGFIRQVETFVRAGALEEADGASLIETADQVLQQIGL